jgi:hypothetical protein
MMTSTDANEVLAAGAELANMSTSTKPAMAAATLSRLNQARQASTCASKHRGTQRASRLTVEFVHSIDDAKAAHSKWADCLVRRTTDESERRPLALLHPFTPYTISAALRVPKALGKVLSEAKSGPPPCEAPPRGSSRPIAAIGSLSPG